MKKSTKIMLGALAIPVGAIVLNACGPMPTQDSSQLALENAADNVVALDAYDMIRYKPFAFYGDLGTQAELVAYGAFSEYGRCNDGWDSDGDGRVDMYDADCHIDPGPLRDNSLFGFPQGHNFFPDVTRIPEGGPGFGGSFRDPEQITSWLRFLTQPDGSTAGIDLIDFGVNPDLVPVPLPLPERPWLGTMAHGNNNNVDIRALHRYYLEHGFIPPELTPLPALPFDKAPSADQANVAVGKKDVAVGKAMVTKMDKRPEAAKGAKGPTVEEISGMNLELSWLPYAKPGSKQNIGRLFRGNPIMEYYAKEKTDVKIIPGTGSQGATRKARTGNGDRSY